MNAIERLRAERPDDFDTESYDDALAAVDALYQAAKECGHFDLHATQWIAGLKQDGSELRAIKAEDCAALIEALAALAAAVRRVEGE